MADEVIVEVAEETLVPPSKEEMRHELHPYQDNNGWCAACGRSEGWKAHDAKAIAAAATAKELEKKKVADLKALAESGGVSLPSGAHKPEIVEALASAGVDPEATPKKAGGRKAAKR